MTRIVPCASDASNFFNCDLWRVQIRTNECRVPYHAWQWDLDGHEVLFAGNLCSIYTWSEDWYEVGTVGIHVFRYVSLGNEERSNGLEFLNSICCLTRQILKEPRTGIIQNMVLEHLTSNMLVYILAWLNVAFVWASDSILLRHLCLILMLVHNVDSRRAVDTFWRVLVCFSAVCGRVDMTFSTGSRVSLLGS